MTNKHNKQAIKKQSNGANGVGSYVQFNIHDMCLINLNRAKTKGVDIPPQSPAKSIHATVPSASTSQSPINGTSSQAEKLKEDGNTAFKAKRYDEAINMYTQAIGTYAR